MPIKTPISGPLSSTSTFLLSSSTLISIVTSSFIALNTLSRNSRISSSTLASAFLTLMTASRLPIPRKPLLPLSITSYSSLSLVVPSLIDASVKASSIVFADTSMYSTIFSPYLRELRSLNSLTILAFEASEPAFALALYSAAFASFSSVPADTDTFALLSIDFVLI